MTVASRETEELAPAPRTSVFHGGLQALRGLLTLGVFLYHAFGNAAALTPIATEAFYKTNIGGVSVLTFFALSGFLISGKAGEPGLRFAVDRVRRIFPAFWLTIGLSLVYVRLWLGVWLPSPWDVMLLIPNGVPNTLPMPHWSLYFEVAFYTLVWAVARLRPGWVRPATLLWGAAGLALYTRPYDFAHYNAPTLYHLIFPVYTLFFAAGVLAGGGFRPRPSLRLPYTLAALPLCFHVYPMEWLGLYRFVPAWLTGDIGFLLIAAGTVCAVRASLCWPADGVVGRCLQRVGDLSFGIYLSHMIFLQLAMRLVRGVVVPDVFVVTYVLIAGLALLPSMAWGALDLRLQRALKRWASTSVAYWPGWYSRSVWPSS